MWISYKIVYIEEEERLGDKIILRFILFKILRESIIIRYREIQKFLYSSSFLLYKKSIFPQNFVQFRCHQHAG